MRKVALTATVAGAVVMSGCILYTKPINTGPTVEIRQMMTTVYRGQEGLFAAITTDPDNDPIELEWSHFAGPCPAPTSPLRPPLTFDFRGAVYVVPPATMEKYCVWVVARDQHGAFAVDNFEVTPLNHAPTARIDVLKPAKNLRGTYDLFSVFALSATGSVDPDKDPLKLAWKLDLRPLMSSRELTDCVPKVKDVLCLTADLPGQYKVSLSVDDGIGKDSADSTTITLDVDTDRPPCIDDTEPGYLVAPTIVIDPDKDRRFEVRHVDDDGDPYPAGEFGEAKFSWSIRKGSDAWQPITGYDLNTLTVAKSTFAIGDKGKLRVEALDRKAGELDRSLVACGDSDLCALRTGCYQRVTWNLEAR